MTGIEPDLRESDGDERRPLPHLGWRRPDFQGETAFHEAGHAVVAYYDGWKFSKVSIIGDWEKAGYLATGRTSRFVVPEPAEVESYAAVLFAGREAVSECLGRTGRSAGSLIDQIRAARWGFLPDAEARALCLERAHRRAREFVRAYRPAVETLADALQNQGEVAGGDARRIIQMAMRCAESRSHCPELSRREMRKVPAPASSGCR